MKKILLALFELVYPRREEDEEVEWVVLVVFYAVLVFASLALTMK